MMPNEYYYQYNFNGTMIDYGNIMPYSVATFTAYTILNIYILYYLVKYVGYDMDYITKLIICNSSVCKYFMIIYLSTYIIISFIKTCILFTFGKLFDEYVKQNPYLLFFSVIDYLHSFGIIVHLIYIVAVLTGSCFRCCIDKINTLEHQAQHQVQLLSRGHKIIYLSQCNICLDDPDEEIDGANGGHVHYPCGHPFHVNCMKHWSGQYCPTCKF